MDKNLIFVHLVCIVSYNLIEGVNEGVGVRMTNRSYHGCFSAFKLQIGHLVQYGPFAYKQVVEVETTKLEGV